LFNLKESLSPESIKLASEFLTILSTIANVIIIAGNHDTNVANKNRLDCIDPIVKYLK